MPAQLPICMLGLLSQKKNVAVTLAAVAGTEAGTVSKAVTGLRLYVPLPLPWMSIETETEKER